VSNSSPPVLSVCWLSFLTCTWSIKVFD
jgi:hypothetical protein